MPQGPPVRLLWLSKETPDRNGQGGQRRQFFQLELLRAAGVDITVLTPAGAQSDASIQEIAHAVRFRRRRLVRLPTPDPLRVASRGYDRMVLAHAESLDLLRGRHTSLRMPWLADFHNVQSRYYGQLGEQPTTAMWLDIEQAILRSSSANLTCSPIESEALRAQNGHAVITEAPNGINPAEWPDSALGARQPFTVAVFGSWWYPPNRLGLEWFLAEVWPGVCSAVPNARLLVAGGDEPPDAVRGAPRVELVGRVPDIAQFLGTVSVVAMPVLRGPGTPVKFAEALASGAAVAATADAASGNPDAPAVMSNDAGALAHGISDLLTHPDEAARRGAAGREYAHARCSWSVTQQPLVNWVLRGEFGTAL
jgi:glycosyltransferase involved in cell wall biosynthesis